MHTHTRNMFLGTEKLQLFERCLGHLNRLTECWILLHNTLKASFLIMKEIDSIWFRAQTSRNSWKPLPVMLSVNLWINEHVNLIELTLKSFRKCVLIKQAKRIIMDKIMILSWISSQSRSKKLKISIIGSLSAFQSLAFPLVLDPFTFFQINNKYADVGPTFCIHTISIQLTLDLNSKVKVYFHEYNTSTISALRTRDLAYTYLGF